MYNLAGVPDLKNPIELKNYMGMPAARMGDNVLQSAPHCHAPIHPAAPVPTPVPHPPMPLTIIKGQPNVLIGGAPAARATDTTLPCMLPSCVPGGPGMIAKGSATVLIGGLPAARLNDMTTHAACVGPIPSPTGKVIGPGCATVMIGG
jgi:uncharacterized Zn-binding protein involved in type VI secretion